MAARPPVAAESYRVEEPLLAAARLHWSMALSPPAAQAHWPTALSQAAALAR
ncbi:MAG TPA: hypothetical protein VFS52_22910 [Steroidobacteraceae bacterium]|nr:hypothetical protein [Steroidobacteraceae bacterium]